MKNFAMLYKMKESLQEFRAAYNRLDPEWQEWLKLKTDIEVQKVMVVHDQLENLEMNELDIDPFEVEGVLDMRADEEELIELKDCFVEVMEQLEDDL